MGLPDVLDIQKKVGISKRKDGGNKNQLIEKGSLNGFWKTVEELDKVSIKELFTNFVEDGSNPSRVVRVFTGLFLAEITAENVVILQIPRNIRQWDSDQGQKVDWGRC